MSGAAVDTPERLAVDVARRMRAAGAAVGPDSALAATEALSLLVPSEPSDVYWALRLALVRRREDLPAFEAAFAAVVGGPQDPPAPPPPPSRPPSRDGDPDGDGAGDGPVVSGDGLGDGDPSGDEEPLPIAASSLEVLRYRDFSLYDEQDFARLAAVLARRLREGPTRRSRRRAPAARGRLDLRATLRASLRSGGVPIARRHRAPRVVPRPLVFLCDVSGSMRAYARAMLQLAHVFAARRRTVEAFAFATRLTRLTPLMRDVPPRVAERRVRAALPDWSGGTRIGDALETLRREHVHRVRGAVVVLASDGWERGDPDRLADAAAWLGRVAHRVVWVSPLLQDPDYEPLTRGLAKALPHADRFEPGHDLASLEALLDLLDGDGR